MIYTRALPLRSIIDKRHLLCVKPKDIIRKAACQMTEHKTGAAVVFDEYWKLVGILTERDIVEKTVGVSRNVDETTVEEIMSPNPITIPVESSVDLALSIMTCNGFRHLPVMCGRRVEGIIDIRDLYDVMEDILSSKIKQNEELLAFAYGSSYSVNFSDIR